MGPRAAHLGRLKVGKFQSHDADHLQAIATTFVRGYNVMFGAAPISRLDDIHDQISVSLRGFLVEGAAMGAAVRDGMVLQAGLLSALHTRYHSKYQYLIQVGSGWALARMPWISRRLFQTLPPELYTLTLDGRGFHNTFFKPERALHGLTVKCQGLAGGAYDQGVGRALWFVSLADLETTLSSVERAHPSRQANLLSGLGLAMSYAGPSRMQDFKNVCDSFPAHQAAFMQGVSFAITALDAAGAVRPELQVLSSQLLGAPYREIVPAIENDRPSDGPSSFQDSLEAYEVWRNRTRLRFLNLINTSQFEV
nr:DUF1702 family protein [Ruegeria arenilitoris]